MTERHARARARSMLSKAGYKSGGHFKPDGSPAKRLIGEAIREHETEDHPGSPHTKLKLKDGGSVGDGMARGGRKHKPRGHKRGHTVVNVVVAQHPEKQPVPVPIPMGGPPPGAGAPPGMPPDQGMPPGMQGAMPGAKTGGRFKDGGSVKIDSQRLPIKGVPEGKLKAGGKAKLAYGGPIGSSTGAATMGGNPIMQQSPMLNNIMAANPGMPMRPAPNVMGMGNMRGTGALLKDGGRATTKKIIDDGSGGGLGRLEKAGAYGAKVKRRGKS